MSTGLLTHSTWHRLVDALETLDALAQEIPESVPLPSPIEHCLSLAGWAIKEVYELPVISDPEPG